MVYFWVVLKVRTQWKRISILFSQIVSVTVQTVFFNQPSSYVVWTGQYDGDPVELRDPGNVPALWEHRLLLRPMPNTTGTWTHTHTQKTTSKNMWGLFVYQVGTLIVQNVTQILLPFLYLLFKKQNNLCN